MPRHKRKKRAPAAPAGGVKRTDWLVGDLVVAKLRGHRPWPAQIQKPEDYGYDARPHRIFVTFFGTEETCFCSYNKITPFTSAVRKSLAEQLQKINTNPELERAIKEIFAADDELKMSLKSHGSHHKEDDIASEKSEGEDPPLERTKKRARVVEEAVPEVVAVDDRPAKQEKTVKNMAVDQVQKLPRKVRIKVSTQSSDSAIQQGALPASDKASVSSSQARQSDVSPPRTSEPADCAEVSVKNDDGPATGNVEESSVLQMPFVASKGDGSTVAGKVDDAGRHVSENGDDATEKIEVDDSSTRQESVTLKNGHESVEQMEVDNQMSVASKAGDDGVEQMEVDNQESEASKTGDGGVEQMKGDNQESVASKTSAPSIGKGDGSLALGIEVSIEGDAPTDKMDDSRDVSSTDQQQSKSTVVGIEVSIEGDDPTGKVDVSSCEQQQSESTVVKVEETLTVDDLEMGRTDKVQVSPVTKEVEVAPSRAKDVVVPSRDQDEVVPSRGQDEVVPSRDQDEQRVSGPELDREEGVEQENKVSVASPKHDVTDESLNSTAKDSVLIPIVLASKVENGADQQDGVQKAQVSIFSKEEEAVSPAELHDEAVKEQGPMSMVEEVAPSQADVQDEAVKEQGPVSMMEKEAPSQAEVGDGAGKEEVSVPSKEEVVSRAEVHDAAVKDQGPVSMMEEDAPSQAEVRDGAAKEVFVSSKEEEAVSRAEVLDGAAKEEVTVSIKEEGAVSRAEVLDGAAKEQGPVSIKEEGPVSRAEVHDAAVKEQGLVSIKEEELVSRAEVLVGAVKEHASVSSKEEEAVSQAEVRDGEAKESVSVSTKEEEAVLDGAVKGHVSLLPKQHEMLPRSEVQVTELEQQDGGVNQTVDKGGADTRQKGAGDCKVSTPTTQEADAPECGTRVSIGSTTTKQDSADENPISPSREQHSVAS